jgi:DNA polymerase
VLGRPATITASRGQLLTAASGHPVIVTIHPSAVLRAPDDEARRAMMRQLVGDLRHAARAAEHDASTRR